MKKATSIIWKHSSNYSKESASKTTSSSTPKARWIPKAHKSFYEIGKILKETGTGRVFTLKDQKRIEDCITKTLKGNGLYYSFKPNIKNIMKYSRKNIALNFLKKLP